MDATTNRSELIRVINDRCRKHFLGCTVIITPMVGHLPDDKRAQLLHAVRKFDAFNHGNDPHHEHDFGAIHMFDEKWLWKYDYYSPDMRHGSDDPSDTEKTRRVLTICHASEY